MTDLALARAALDLLDAALEVAEDTGLDVGGLRDCQVELEVDVMAREHAGGAPGEKRSVEDDF